MGASASVNTTVNNISNSVTNTLQQTVNASASANCNVTIGSISFKSTKGCTVSVTNMCSATASGVLEATLDGVFSAVNGLETENLQQAPQLLTASLGINTTVNNIRNDFSTYVQQQCGATSSLDQNITIQNIDLGVCEAPGGQVMNFPFINTGNAAANCALGIVQKVLVAATNEITTKNSQTNSYGAIILGLIAIAGIAGVLAFLWFAKRLIFPTQDEKVINNWSKINPPPWALEYIMLRRANGDHIAGDVSDDMLQTPIISNLFYDGYK